MVLASKKQPPPQGDDEKREREDPRTEPRPVKLLITVIGIDEDGQEGVLGSYLEPLSAEDAERFMCHGSAVHSEYVDAGNAMEHEIYDVACWFVAEGWRSFAHWACRNAIDRGDCEGHGLPVASQHSGPPPGSAFASFLGNMDVDMPECDGQCDECKLWEKDVDACPLTHIDDDDQDRLDALLS